VQINLIQKHSFDLRYVLDKIPNTEPSLVPMWKSLNRVTTTCMMHLKNMDGNDAVELYYCTGDSDQIMKDSLEDILKVLVAYTGCKLRELAVIHQRTYDPMTFAQEQLARVGLFGSPPQYIS